jgi:hypothetical protein
MTVEGGRNPQRKRKLKRKWKKRMKGKEGKDVE